MKTYLSIDCDYFAPIKSASARIQAERLIRVLEMLDLPVFVTLGHDLHAIDVNQFKVQKIINVDVHCDCDCDTEYGNRMKTFLEQRRKTSLTKKLCEYSARWETLHEANWVHFCNLVGSTPRVEHWRPLYDHRCREVYSEKTVWLVSGEAGYKNRVVTPKNLCRAIEKIKNDIVAVGLAISPFWCETLSAQMGCKGWTADFLEVLIDREVAS